MVFGQAHGIRPDAVPDEVLTRVLRAGHQAPSVGHSQPWRFVVVREAVVTSGRKVRSHTALDMLVLFCRFARAGPRALQTRDGLEFWYGPRQDN